MAAAYVAWVYSLRPLALSEREKPWIAAVSSKAEAALLPAVTCRLVLHLVMSRLPTCADFILEAERLIVLFGAEGQSRTADTVIFSCGRAVQCRPPEAISYLQRAAPVCGRLLSSTQVAVKTAVKLVLPLG